MWRLLGVLTLLAIPFGCGGDTETAEPDPEAVNVCDDGMAAIPEQISGFLEASIDALDAPGDADDVESDGEFLRAEINDLDDVCFDAYGDCVDITEWFDTASTMIDMGMWSLATARGDESAGELPAAGSFPETIDC